MSLRDENQIILDVFVNDIKVINGAIDMLLNEREKVVIYNSYGMLLPPDDKPKTLAEVGLLLGVSGARAGQIRTKAIRKLRSKLSIQIKVV